MVNLEPPNVSIPDKDHYYESVYVVLTHPEKYIGRRISIGGKVVGDTIQFDGHFVIFKIKDACTAPLLPDDDPDHGYITIVLVNGSQPTLLQDGVKAIAAGTMRPDGIFCADDLALVTACAHL